MSEVSTAAYPPDGANFRIVPAHRIVTRTEAMGAIAHVHRANRDAASLYSYDMGEDAIVIYRRRSERGRAADAMQWDEEWDEEWDSVGAILSSLERVGAGLIEIYALEVLEGYEPADVARHIGLLFGPGPAGDAPVRGARRAG